MADRSWSGKHGGNLAEKLPPSEEPEAPVREGAMVSHAIEQVSLELIFADGEKKAMDLAYVDYEGTTLTGDVLCVYFHKRMLRAEGMHLDLVRQKVRRHKAVTLWERHRSELLLDDGKPYISKLEVLPLDPEGLQRKA